MRLYSTWQEAMAGHVELVAEHRAIHKAVTKLKSVTGSVTNLKPLK
jgi:hypothetical protein